MNLYDVLRFFVSGLANGAVSIRSAAISFRLLVAVFGDNFIAGAFSHTLL